MRDRILNALDLLIDFVTLGQYGLAPAAPERLYVIESGDDEYDYYSLTERTCYWSNEHGWADLPSATVFNATERDELNLPFDAAEWVQLPIYDPNCHQARDH